MPLLRRPCDGVFTAKVVGKSVGSRASGRGWLPCARWQGWQECLTRVSGRNGAALPCGAADVAACGVGCNTSTEIVVWCPEAAAGWVVDRDPKAGKALGFTIKILTGPPLVPKNHLQSSFSLGRIGWSQWSFVPNRRACSAKDRSLKAALARTLLVGGGGRCVSLPRVVWFRMPASHGENGGRSDS
jgi:hypothetical protein